MITIRCNGKEIQATPESTVLDIINDLALNPATVVVEYDRLILKPEEYAGQRLQEGAVLEIIRFVGGG